MIRIATYNIEWFDALFADDGTLLNDNRPSGRHGIRCADQITALGRVLLAVNADAVMVIEAPDQNRNRDTVSALQGFARHHRLRTSAAVIGFANDSQQEIALLYDPGVMQARHAPGGAVPAVAMADPDPPFDGSLQIDLDGNGQSQEVRFSKPPLEVALDLAAGGRVHLIGVHLKSKAPYGTRNQAQADRVSVENRRKQLAQSLWLRRRVLQHLAAGEALVVLGDFNDGPGLDPFEKLLGRSGLEVVLGWDGPVEQRLFDPHAQLVLAPGQAVLPTSSRFYVAHELRYLAAMLDYVMVSPDLRALDPQWRIWHPFDDPACAADPVLSAALLAASDHFPVSLDLALPASPKGQKGV